LPSAFHSEFGEENVKKTGQNDLLTTMQTYSNAFVASSYQFERLVSRETVLAQ